MPSKAGDGKRGVHPDRIEAWEALAVRLSVKAETLRATDELREKMLASVHNLIRMIAGATPDPTKPRGPAELYRHKR